MGNGVILRRIAAAIACACFSFAAPAADMPASDVRNLSVAPVSRAPVPARTAPTELNRVARLHADDIYALNALVYEGQRLFLTDVVRRQASSCLQYCSVSVRQAVEGRVRDSIRSASKALHLASTQNEEMLLAMSKRDLASAYNFAGKDEIAFRLANEALEHERRARLNPTDVQMPLYRIRGDVYLRRGEPARALADYDRAMQLTYPNQRAFIRESALKAHVAAGDSTRARAVAQDLLSEDGVEFRRAALIGLGELALREGNVDLAVQQFTQAVRLASSGASFRVITAHDGLARSFVRKGDRARAIASYEEAIAAAESLRRRFNSEEFRAGVFGEMQRLFAGAVTQLSESGRDADAWQASERGRSRSLLDMLGGGVRASAARAVIADPFGQVRPLGQVSAAVGEGAALVQFHVLEDRTYAWIIRGDGLRAARLEIGREALALAVRRFREAVSDPESPVTAQSRDLFASLISPLELRPGEKLVLVPHGSLHYLPFQALSDGQRYLVEDHAISYAPSASAYVNLVARAAAGKDRLFAMGNPDLRDPALALPGAAREVDAIRQHFVQASVLKEAAATKESFLANAEKFDVLHIAAHAEVDPIDPMYSRIALSGPDVVSGELAAHEIYRLNLSNTRLVTLSACETGLGRVTQGDEVWGFTRAFLGAGARSLMTSLWEVSDEATDLLMERFYERARGSDMRGALRDAQLALVSSPRFAHPYYWAAFNLVGDWR